MTKLTFLTVEFRKLLSQLFLFSLFLFIKTTLTEVESVTKKESKEIFIVCKYVNMCECVCVQSERNVMKKKKNELNTFRVDKLNKNVAQ